MKILLLSMFALSICAAEMPSDVQAAIDKADKACSTVQAKADSDITKLRQGLVASLTKLQEGYTKKGNLDAANGIKAKIDEVNKAIDDYLIKNTPQVSTSKTVIIYSEPNFKGVSEVITTYGVVISNLHFPNDSLRSIRVPVGYKVTAYENEMGGGRSVTLTKDDPKITDTVALGMSSIMVDKP